jgi:hypothetical protein
MTIAQRAAGMAMYKRWFYAPHFTGRHCVERLYVLGFVWNGKRWTPPSAVRFLQGITQ